MSKEDEALNFVDAYQLTAHSGLQAALDLLSECATEIADLRTRCEKAENDAGWQLIESAPRGLGERFLGWDGELIDLTREGWENDDKSPMYVHNDWVSWKPTHWRAIPNPPKT